MPLKLVHLKSDDEFDELVRCEFAAYDTPPCKLKNLFFPPQGTEEATVQEAVQRQTAWHRGDPTSYWIKVVDTDNNDQLLGAACWHVYDADPYAAESDEECDWFAKGEDRDVANALMGQFVTPRMTYMRKPHICKPQPPLQPKDDVEGIDGESEAGLTLAQSSIFASHALTRDGGEWASSLWTGASSRPTSEATRYSSMPQILAGISTGRMASSRAISGSLICRSSRTRSGRRSWKSC